MHVLGLFRMCGLSGLSGWWLVWFRVKTFRVHDKWICQRIVNAAPRHWCDVVSDACQIHAAHSSHKCVSSCIVCALVFGVWVIASKCYTLKTVPFCAGPIKLFLTWIKDLHAAKVSKFDNSV